MEEGESVHSGDEAGADIFRNNHDLIGVEGIIRAQ
jgi:hypothetical protein